MLAAASVLAVLSSVLSLIAVIEDEDRPGGYTLARGLWTADAILAVALWIVAARAFLGPVAARTARLLTAAVLAVAAGAFSLGASAASSAAGIADDIPGTGVAADVMGLINSAFYVAATILLARAFASDTADERDDRGARAAVVFAVGWMFAIGQIVLLAILYRDLGATDGFIRGLWFVAAGAAVLLAAPTFAAIALRARRSLRDALLSVAAGVFAFATGLSTIGAFLLAGSIRENGLQGAEVTSAWLDAFVEVGTAGAAVCVAAGLAASSRRSPASD